MVIDPVSLAATAVAVLAPYKVAAAQGAAKKAGEASFDASVKMFRFLKGKLKAEEQEKALSRIETDSSDTDNQAALRVVLKEALQNDQAFRDEMKALLESLPITETSQSLNVVGSNNKTAQVSGHGNSTNIS